MSIFRALPALAHGPEEGRRPILDGPATVRLGAKAKLVERHLVLFSDALVILRVKKNRKKADSPSDWTFTYEQSMPLPLCRIIAVADSSQTVPSFQLTQGARQWTIHQVAAADRDTWFNTARDLVREFQRARLTDLRQSFAVV